MGTALQRAAPLLRLPGAPDQAPTVLAGESGVQCPVTRRVFAFHDGFLDLLPEHQPRTITQRSLDTTLTAWAYDHMRDGLLRAVGLPPFPAEVASIQQRLQVTPGDVVLDLACGHGNFTAAWAQMARHDGLVIGLDVSLPMLRRAATRTAHLDNVLLIHGDAQQLPFGDALLHKVNCSGGFHQIPDLPRALREIARVTAGGSVLTASMFAENPHHPHPRLRQWLQRRLALHLVPLLWLGEQLEVLGFADYQWTVPKGGFGYASAVKRARNQTAP